MKLNISSFILKNKNLHHRMIDRLEDRIDRLVDEPENSNENILNLG